MLGPYHDMQPGPPYIDDEKELVGGTAIERDPVFLGNTVNGSPRCYTLASSIEAPTGIHAPNAQVKEAAVKFGGVPISREGHFAILKELVQVCPDSFQPFKLTTRNMVRPSPRALLRLLITVIWHTSARLSLPPV